MASSDDLNPSEFVERIRKLGEQRDFPDLDRAKKLEEEILQGRSERAARRAERQRSISPEKASTPRSFRSSAHISSSPAGQTPPVKNTTMDIDSDAQARARNETGDQHESSATPDSGSPTRRELPVPPTKDGGERSGSTESTRPLPSPGLGRSGTLSWQQRRPPSRGATRRPLSVVAAENSAARSPRETPEPQSTEEQTLSRNQIAQSLGAKDPSWFKQTADRGLASPAYRKSQVEDEGESTNRWSGGSSIGRARTPETLSLPARRRQLPGLSRESTAEPEDSSSPPPESVSSVSPSVTSSVRGSTTWSNRMSNTTYASTTSAVESKSPLPILDSQKFSPPLERTPDQGPDSIRALAMSPSQGRISPERTDRPASPTKGLGGFVQSAMLRRSDSQNKRWSAQPGTGLSRQSSTASNSSRAGGISSSGGLQSFETRPSTLSRGNSLEPSSRPSSSHSSKTITQDATEKQPSTDADGFVKPALPFHSRSRSVASTTPADCGSEVSPPPSPSKRWSPTKSSWLESALSKPTEQPKPKTSSIVPQQPSWMADLNKAKQQRGSVDMSNSATSKPAPAPRPTSTDKSAAPAPAKSLDKNDPSPVSVSSATKPAVLSPKDKPTVSSPKDKPTSPTIKDKPRVTSGSLGTRDTKSRPDPLSTKPKPVAPPKNDFRANLRSRQGPAETAKAEEPEFKNVFGKLRRAETKNYVAPDTLKDNILRGKADLTLTGGPKPRVKRDELKESLLQKKEEIKVKVAESGSVAGKKAEPIVQAVPEALARRKTLSRSDAPKERPVQPQPEALARQASLKDKPAPVPPKKSFDSPIETPSTTAKPSKLADRFNPALAGILARGPSPVKSTSSPAPAESSTQVNAHVQKDAGPAKELTHMTKGRAKGPKRRAPTSKAVDKEPEEPKPAVHETPKKSTARVPSVSLVKPQHVLSSNAPDSATRTVSPLPPKPTRSSLTPKPKPSPTVKASEPEEVVEKRVASPKSPFIFKRVSTQAASKDLTVNTKEDTPTAVNRDSGESGRSSHDAAFSVQPLRISPTKNVLNRFSQNLESNRANTLKATSSDDSRTEEAARLSPTKVAFNRFSVAAKAKQGTSIPTETHKHDSSNGDPSTPASKPLFRSVEPQRPLPSPKSAISRVASPSQAEAATPERKEPRDEQAVDDLSNVSVRSASALWGRQSASGSPEPSKVKAPIKLPTKADEQSAMENAGLSKPQAHRPTGLGIGSIITANAPKQEQVSSPPLSARLKPQSPPLSAKSKPQSPSPLAPARSSYSSKPLPLPVATDPNNVFAGRFDIPPDTTGELPSDIDTQAILKSSPMTAEKIKTLRNQIWELGSDGGLSHIPIQEEHVLYEESMYLLTHLYSSATSLKTTEVYLWIGATIPETVVEEATLFGGQHAKENGAKNVTVIRQGKEPPRFFEALGGIVVVRRGTRETAPEQYMLCGRRHLGHLAFDEVELTRKSLCSGFPYLIAISNGAAYLWKGIGCSAEEQSGARLIGMDLAKSGELIEVTEGQEPAALLSIFPDSNDKPPRSADHWRYKAGSDRYGARLFRIEQTQAAPLKPQTGFLSSQVSSFLWPSKLLGARKPSWQNLMSSLPSSSSPSSAAPTTTTTALSPLPQSPSPSSPSAAPSSYSNHPAATATAPSPVPSPTSFSPQKSRPPLNASSDAPWHTAVKEIAPFTQTDLEPEAVYVLDAFFEIYILLGPLANTQHHAFATALLFAQEYGILATSADDRPFIPVCTVVLEGVPRDLKAVFRRWDESVGVGGSAGLMAGKLGRGKSLRVVGLGKALSLTGR